MEHKNLEAMENHDGQLKQAAIRELTIEEKRELAHKACEDIASELPTRELVIRFRRRHAGFVRGHFVTDNHHLSLLYGHRLIEEGGNDAAIGHAIKRAVHAHFAAYHHLYHDENTGK